MQLAVHRSVFYGYLNFLAYFSHEKLVSECGIVAVGASLEVCLMQLLRKIKLKKMRIMVLGFAISTSELIGLEFAIDPLRELNSTPPNPSSVS